MTPANVLKVAKIIIKDSKLVKTQLNIPEMILAEYTRRNCLLIIKNNATR